MDLNKVFATVQEASRELLSLSDGEINQILQAVADAALAKSDLFLQRTRKIWKEWILKPEVRPTEINRRTPSRHRSGYTQRSYPPLSRRAYTEREYTPQRNET
mgnify:CR=1 FL=1